MKRTTPAMLLGAATLLAACGGGGSAVESPQAVPQSALATPAAFTQYVAGQAEDDRREPWVVDGIVPPTSETADPLPLAR